jgi:hypothetical protein
MKDQLIFCQTNPNNLETVNCTIVGVGGGPQILHGEVPTGELIGWLRSHAKLVEVGTTPLRKTG